MKHLATLLVSLGAAAGLGCQGKGQLVPVPAERAPVRGDLSSDYLVPPPEVYENAPKGVLENHGGPHVLYVNFDGAALRGGSSCSNSQQNCSFIVQCAGTSNYPAYSGSNRQQVLQLLGSWLAPYNVQMVTERPASGNYTMAMVGGSTSAVCYENGEAAGVAPLECQPFTSSGASNHIVFAFSEVVGNDTLGVAATIAQEAAHAWGLEHTNNPNDALYPYLTDRTDGFLDMDMGVVGNGGGNRAQCTGMTTQNSHRMMLAALGPSGPDTAPPTVRFAEPQDGAQVSPTFLVRIEAMDNFGAPRVELIVDEGQPGEMRATGMAPPYQWNVTNFAAGAHTFKAVATDGVNMQAIAQITVTVVAQGGGGQGGGAAGSGMAGSGMAGSGGGQAGGGGEGGGEGGGQAGGGQAGAGGQGGGGGSMPDDVGNDCERSSECASRICAKQPGQDVGVCTADCAVDDDCGADLVCLDFEGASAGKGLCLPDNFLEGESKKASCAVAAGAGRDADLGLVLLAFGALALVLRRRGVR